MDDETAADDGALFAFWAFVVDVLEGRRVAPFDPHRLDVVADMVAAVEAFDALGPA